MKLYTRDHSWGHWSLRNTSGFWERRNRQKVMKTMTFVEVFITTRGQGYPRRLTDKRPTMRPPVGRSLRADSEDVEWQLEILPDPRNRTQR